MKIGLSLSFCIKDIIEGKVDEDEVLCIITGTKGFGFTEQLEIIDSYTRSYWVADVDRARNIAHRFFAQNRIIQPRTFDMLPPNISRGHWMEVQ